MVCGLDSRQSRLYANQTARQLGIHTLLDAGVESSQLLARVNVHRSDSASSCLQCGWSDADYNLIEATNPCQLEDSAPSTNAPAALGAMAASLLTIELKKLIDGDLDHVATGKQITFCALTHKLYVTAIGRNPECRCDHDPWRVTSLKHSAHSLTLGQALRLGKSFSVPGKTFIRALVCRNCAAHRTLLRLEGRLKRRQLICARCNSEMAAPGFDQLERLDRDSLGENSPWLSRPLAKLGIVNGDILCFGGAKGNRHLEIGIGAKTREVLHV